MFDFTLTEEQFALQTLVREFVQKEIKHRVAALDTEQDPAKCIPWDIIKAINEVGLKNLALKKEFEGAGQDTVTLGICAEELGFGDLGVSAITSQDWKVTNMLQEGGTKEQIEKYLIPWRDDPWGVMTIAVTEAESGSDSLVPCLDPKAGPKMSCIRDGDYAILNGIKEFICCSAISHLYVVFARSNRDVPLTDGMTAFVIPRDLPGVENIPGFTVGPLYDKMGERLACNAPLIFEDCRVPMANMLWEWDKAWQNMPKVLRHSNALAGAEILGVGWAAFERALEYAQIRVQGAVPIIQHANISIKLSEMYTQLRAAQLMVRKGCWQADHPEYFDPMLARSIKTFCSEVAMMVTLEALKMHGGTGGMRNVGMEKMVRDAVEFLHSDGCNDSLNRGSGELLAKVPYIR